jgi:enoyl-CoA hydratase
MNKPVIMAVNGFALGGGCELAMAGDIRIASEKAKFGQPEVNLGLIPGYGGSQRTTRLVGKGMAMFLCLSGDIIDAQLALQIGLVDRVVPHDELLASAKKLANTIAEKAPLAIAACKHVINSGAHLAMEDALELEALAFGTLVNTKDFREGTGAFLEKRKPNWTAS